MAARTEPSPVRGSADLIAARLGGSAITLAGTAIVARTLSPRDWGAYTFVLGLATILGLLFDFQVSRLVLVELVEERRDPGAVLGSFLTLRLGLGAASYLAALAFAAAAYPSLVAATSVGALTIVFGAGWNALFLYFQARLRLRAVALWLTVARIVFLGLVALFAVAGSTSLVVYLSASVAVEAVPLAALALVLRRHVRLRPAVEVARWRLWLKDALPIALGFALTAVYYRVDTLMLALLDNLRSVGLYGAGYKFADFFGYLSTAVLTPALTLFVRAWPDRVEPFRRNWRGAVLLSALGAAGTTAWFVVFARPALEAVFGAPFGAAATAARLVVIGQGLGFFIALAVTTLVAVRRRRPYVVAALAGLAVNVAANAVVIPRYSYLGAAWVTLATQIVVLALLARALVQVRELVALPWAGLARAGAAAAVLAAVGAGVDSVAPWPVAAATAAVAFLGALHVLGVDGPGGLRAVPRLLSLEG